MNDDFTFLIFTYHNVFHSLLASFRLRKWRLLALVSSDVDVTCVLSLRSAFPTQRRWVMMKTHFQPKIGLKQPNVLTQRCQPSIWVEKITQRFLECTYYNIIIKLMQVFLVITIISLWLEGSKCFACLCSIHAEVTVSVWANNGRRDEAEGAEGIFRHYFCLKNYYWSVKTRSTSLERCLGNFLKKECLL